jgi:hypothetical protein
MSLASAQYAVFVRDVAKTGRVWTIRDSGGHPAPKNSRGVRAQPFWSSLSRTQKIIDNVPAYAGFAPEELDLATFRELTLPGLARDRLEVGVNWSGKDAEGYDVRPADLERRLTYELSRLGV